jgi:transposase-like protein
VTPFEAGGLTEDEAYAAFKAFRFCENGGRPFCVKCGCDAINHYRCRPIYKCKSCGAQFSATSGTPWANRKLPFRKLMYLVASLAHKTQVKSVRELCQDIGVQYKTALLWFHKLRSEIARHADAQKLSGEVEIDGAYFGGFIRPKNLAKTRKDLRKIPYRDNDRALCVVTARQRGGPIRTWVAKNEGDARLFIKDAIERGSVVFADMAPAWTSLCAKFELFQVNHKEAYSTPEACTNQAETLWALMRVMGRVHRHIAQNYFDLYAAEAAWTLRKSKQRKGEAFSDLMGWMSRLGRSPLSGYFQGRKRACPVCKSDGSTQGWRPAPRKGKVAFIQQDSEPVLYKPRRPLAKSWQEGFTFMSVDAFAANFSSVPDGPGVYAVFIRGGAAMLERTGYVEDPALPLWRRTDADHVYTGETYGIRSRLAQHLNGDIRVSNLRETLLALQSSDEALLGRASLDRGRDASEESLTRWLRTHAVIGYRSCGYVRDVEAAILSATASPLNVSRQNPTAYTATLLDLRRRFHSDVVSGWPKPPTTMRPKRR